MNRDKVLSMIGLATRAGKTASGGLALEEAVKGGKAFLVVLADDASDRTKKDVRNMCEFRSVKLMTYGTKEQLGMACGKEYRSGVAITDEELAKAITKAFEDR